MGTARTRGDRARSVLRGSLMRPSVGGHVVACFLTGGLDIPDRAMACYRRRVTLWVRPVGESPHHRRGLLTAATPAGSPGDPGRRWRDDGASGRGTTLRHTLHTSWAPFRLDGASRRWHAWPRPRGAPAQAGTGRDSQWRRPGLGRHRSDSRASRTLVPSWPAALWPRLRRAGRGGTPPGRSWLVLLRPHLGRVDVGALPRHQPHPPLVGEDTDPLTYRHHRQARLLADPLNRRDHRPGRVAPVLDAAADDVGELPVVGFGTVVVYLHAPILACHGLTLAYVVCRIILA